jgi:signal peptidase II
VSRFPHAKAGLAVTATILLLDQIIKVWAVAALEGERPRNLVGGLLRLDLVRNPGAAFSLGSGRTVVFTVVSAVVSVVLLRLVMRATHRGWALAFGALLGGAVGNLTDRLFRDPGFPSGHVVDMFRLPNFPVFNVADASITCAVVAMFWLSLRGVEPWEKKVEQ